MWLRNYYNLLTAILLGNTTQSSTDEPTDYTPPIRVRLPNGNYKTTLYENLGSTSTYRLQSGLVNLIIGKQNARYLTDNLVNYYEFAIQFGTGTTAVTYDDYNLVSPITSGLTLVAEGGNLKTPSTFDNDTHHYSSEKTYTINNSSGGSITLTEVGIFAPNGGSSATNKDAVLIYREVFEEPITLDNGESVIISFKRDAEVLNYRPY